MTLTIGLPRPTGAGIAGMFRPGGDYYSKISDVIFDRLPGLLPRRLRRMILNAVPWVVRALEKLAAGELLDERVTDAMIAGLAGVSVRVVQYALWALDVLMDQAGMPIIRRIRTHGRRIIEFIRGFAPSGTKGFSPLHPPSILKKQRRQGRRRRLQVSLGKRQGKPGRLLLKSWLTGR